MWTDAWAQAPAAGSPDPRIGFLLQMVPFLLMFFVIYLVIIRPQQTKQKQTEKMLGALKKGDRVLTTGGLYGTVVDVDQVKAVLKIGGDVKAEFAKSAIVQIVTEDGK